MEQVSILIIEDEAVVAAHLASTVTGCGYRVIGVVATGEEAIQVAQQQCPDLFLIDIRLVGALDGIETAKRLQTICDSPVIFLTAHSDQETLKRASLVGPFGYILKPFDDRDVVTQLQIGRYMHQAARRLRASEERWQLALRGSTDGIWDWDIRNHTVFFSPRWKTIRGYSEDEIGLNENEWISRIHPDDLERAMETVSAYLSRRASEYQCEYRSKCKDGSYIWILDRGMAVWDDDGPVRMVGSETDITPRKQAEQALRDSQERLTGIVTTAMDAIISVDSHFRITLFNHAAEQLFGCRAQDAIGDHLERFMPERFRREHGHHMAEFGQAGTTTRRMGRFGKIYGLRANGEEFPLEASISKLTVNGEKLYTVILRDITERQQQEDTLRLWNDNLEIRVQARTQELITSQERLRELARELNLAEQRERKRLATELHDHLAQLLVLARLKVAQVKRTAGEQLGLQCVELLKQTDETLSESLSYTRTLVADLTPPILHEFGLSAALKWLAERMHQHQLSVTLEMDSLDGVRLPEDNAVLIFQSVRELLLNAAKHAQCGHATVSVARQPRELRIEVCDEGVGYDPVAAASTRSQTPLSSKFGHFSIRERMTALGGTFEVTTGVGKGTIARLVLPLHEASFETRNDLTLPLQVQRLGAPLVTREEPTSIRVLLVDDHAMMRQGLRSVLEGYPDVEIVGEACDGEEAVVAVGELLPSVVIMDINMPKMNGIEATTRIRSDHPGIVVIGLSVNAGLENQAAMHKAGACTILTKEAAVEELYGAIQQAMKEAKDVTLMKMRPQ